MQRMKWAQCGNCGHHGVALLVSFECTNSKCRNYAEGAHNLWAQQCADDAKEQNNVPIAAEDRLVEFEVIPYKSREEELDAALERLDSYFEGLKQSAPVVHMAVQCKRPSGVMAKRAKYRLKTVIPKDTP